MCNSWVFTSWCARDKSGEWTYSPLSGWVNSSDCSWPGHYTGSGIADLFALKFESSASLQSSLTVKIAQDGVNRKDWLIAWCRRVLPTGFCTIANSSFVAFG
ncbi:hypothetical protein V6N13_056140 [Hibiscus sabdariffa]